MKNESSENFIKDEKQSNNIDCVSSNNIASAKIIFLNNCVASDFESARIIA